MINTIEGVVFFHPESKMDPAVMLKKIIRLIIVWCLLFPAVRPAAGAETVRVEFFWGLGCPHCAREKVFLEKLAAEHPRLEIHDYEVFYDRENSRRLQAIGRELAADVSGVPFTVIGDKYFIGYAGDETTGKAIEAEIIRRLGVNPVSSGQESIKVPWLGEIDPKNFSLPALTVIIAALDGFNPCAMWTLLFLISLLLGMKDKTRMWLLGSAFIAASALVYFLFLAAWLNLFLFLGLVVWVRIMIGLVALAAGGYYLHDYRVNRGGACTVTGGDKKQRIFSRLKAITQNRNFFPALVGIIVLAFAVNLVELVCSAGLPAVYTQILSLSQLSRWQYYLYLAGYIFVFMLDDLLVFFTAMLTLRAAGLRGKYARISRLSGAVLMLIIGLLLLFKPEWLMFI